jgi:hypothetical protein
MSVCRSTYLLGDEAERVGVESERLIGIRSCACARGAPASAHDDAATIAAIRPTQRFT